MAKERISRETLLLLVNCAIDETISLSVSSVWAHKHLGDKQGAIESERQGREIQDVLNHVRRLLENITDEIEDERGMHNARLETLIEKRDRMNERIEKMRGKVTA